MEYPDVTHAEGPVVDIQGDILDAGAPPNQIYYACLDRPNRIDDACIGLITWNATAKARLWTSRAISLALLPPPNQIY